MKHCPHPEAAGFWSFLSEDLESLERHTRLKILLNPDGKFDEEVSNVSLEIPYNFVTYNEDIELVKRVLEFLKEEQLK